jgi:hypothetical protein
MLALFGHGAMSELSPLSGGKRKSDFGAVRSAFDPTLTKRPVSIFRLRTYDLPASLLVG